MKTPNPHLSFDKIYLPENCLYIYIYIYIYTCVCVCMCVSCSPESSVGVTELGHTSAGRVHRYMDQVMCVLVPVAVGRGRLT